MSAPCVRIELTYADGSYQVAQDDAAEKIRQWLNLCQAFTADEPTIRYDGPQLDFHPAPGSETEVRGDQESAS